MVALNDGVFATPLQGGFQASSVTKGGITYLPYTLLLDSACRPFLPSGAPVRNGDQLVQLLAESLGNRMDCGGPTTLTNTLVLGALPPGNYQLRFVTDGVTAQTVPIIVSPGTGQLLTTELAAFKTGLHLIVNGLPEVSYSIQASADLIDWAPIFTQAGSFTFTETLTKNSRPRFYRVSIAD